jgi:iron complex outermembrane receptor protein
MKNKHFEAVEPRLSALHVAISFALCSGAWAQQVPQLSPVIVIGERMPALGISLGGESLNTRRFATNDTATLLDGLPGVSFFSGGGVSSLPVIHGLGDDRLKITVDGMSITSACPNHMNPALSYIDPAALSEIKVYAGIVPVSEGGDSIGGAIAVKSAPPVFAQPGQGLKTSGNITGFHRSNGSANGASVQANVATESVSIGYVGNTVEAANYKDGNGQALVASRYKVRNNAIKVAALTGADVWTVAMGWQDIPFQGYPNQSMDMTYNKSFSINTGYTGNFDWGVLEARAFRQHVRHKMDVLQDKAVAAGFPAASSYMPMDTDAVDMGYSVIGTAPFNENQTVRFGHEFHRYALDDWWPALVGSGAMEPNTFWNINGGRRNRLAVFGEVDTQVSDKLSTQVGARVEHVTMNTGAVQGYYGAGAPFGDAYETDAASFNAKGRQRKDLNVDLTASARYVNNANETYDIGFSRKTRSPNLHERYTWANEAMMAGLMNNWFGDLNSYVGSLGLRPEVAYSLKASADWHDAERQSWQLKATPFYTFVRDYINVAANTSSNPYNVSGLLGRQSLMFTNQDAQLYGVDMSGKKLIGKAYGEWTLRAAFSYTRGKTTSGDSLYNIMPLNARVAIDQAMGAWSNTLEAVLVGAKNNLSAIRAEQTTAGYTTVSYRSTYKWNESVRWDVGVDNLLNRQYRLPAGGLEYVSGNMMSAPRPLRATGRSVNVGVSVSF